MAEVGESPIPKEISPSEIRSNLMDKFSQNLDILHPKILENRSNESNLRQRPLVTVVVSLWEEDDTFLTSKMFGEALPNLRNQASSSGMDLDFVIVANNGGGKTEELGHKMTSRLDGFLKSQFEESYYHVNTTPLDQTSDPAIPWNTEIPLSKVRSEGKDRCYLIEQPFNKLNEGKIRALRDVSNSLYQEILEGYAPDAVFQMDAETILEYRPTHLTLVKQPFRAMYDALKRRDGVVAIGTKDHLEVMDPETGKPLGVTRPIAQELMTQINSGKRERFISLPGGALLAEPEYYVSGMKAISEVTYGSVAEDYMFTQILREYGKTNGIPNIIKVNSLNIISHLNRTPQGDAAIQQLLRWKRQGNAVDEIFPDSKHQYKPMIEYIRRLIKSRLKDAGKNKRLFLSQTIEDFKSLPGLLEIARDKDTADLVKGKSSWGHSGEK